MRNHRSLAAWCAGLLWVFSQQLSVQDPTSEPTVFRKVGIGDVFPTLVVSEPGGEPLELEPPAGMLDVIAFVRPDQADSRLLIADLQKLALDKEIADLSVSLVGMRSWSDANWKQLTRGLPRRVRAYIGGDGPSQTLGLIVLPSVALVDASGNLARAYVLHDEELSARIRADIAHLQGAEADEETLQLIRFRQLEVNASALEAAGELSDALTLRLGLLAIGIQRPRVQADLGRTYLAMGDASAAVVHLRESLDLQQTVATRALLGRALARTGATEEATAILEALLPETPEPALIHRELAHIYKNRGDLDSAIVHLKAAIAAAWGDDRMALEARDEER